MASSTDDESENHLSENELQQYESLLKEYVESPTTTPKMRRDLKCFLSGGNNPAPIPDIIEELEIRRDLVQRLRDSEVFRSTFITWPKKSAILAAFMVAPVPKLDSMVTRVEGDQIIGGRKAGRFLQRAGTELYNLMKRFERGLIPEMPDHQPTGTYAVTGRAGARLIPVFPLCARGRKKINPSTLREILADEAVELLDELDHNGEGENIRSGTGSPACYIPLHHSIRFLWTCGYFGLHPHSQPGKMVFRYLGPSRAPTEVNHTLTPTDPG